jgi:hypothetical protein
MMLRLADTSIRLVPKEGGKISPRLRSYLRVQTDVGFRLSMYLKDIFAEVTLPTGAVIQYDRVAFLTLLHGSMRSTQWFTPFGPSCCALANPKRSSRTTSLLLPP